MSDRPAPELLARFRQDAERQRKGQREFAWLTVLLTPALIAGIAGLAGTLLFAGIDSRSSRSGDMTAVLDTPVMFLLLFVCGVASLLVPAIRPARRHGRELLVVGAFGAVGALAAISVATDALVSSTGLYVAAAIGLSMLAFVLAGRAAAPDESDYLSGAALRAELEPLGFLSAVAGTLYAAFGSIGGEWLRRPLDDDDLTAMVEALEAMERGGEGALFERLSRCPPTVRARATQALAKLGYVRMATSGALIVTMKAETLLRSS